MRMAMRSLAWEKGLAKVPVEGGEVELDDGERRVLDPDAAPKELLRGADSGGGGHEDGGVPAHTALVQGRVGNRRVKEGLDRTGGKGRETRGVRGVRGSETGGGEASGGDGCGGAKEHGERAHRRQTARELRGA